MVGESNETGWTPVLSQVETFDAASIETAFVGEASVAVTVDRFTLGFAPTELVSPVGFASLRFAFHPSDATAANPQLTVNVGATRLSLVGDERIEATVDLSRSTGRSSTYHWPHSDCSQTTASR